jgi:hypothetical protein
MLKLIKPQMKALTLANPDTRGICSPLKVTLSVILRPYRSRRWGQMKENSLEMLSM